MGVSTWMVAQKRLSFLDRQLINAFNILLTTGVEPPADLIAKLRSTVGDLAVDKALVDETFKLENDVLEVSLYGLWKGKAEYDAGMILNLDVLPEGTFAIRVYMD